MRISDWSSDVCSSDLDDAAHSRRDDEVDRVPQLARQLGGERRGEAAGAVAVHQDACALQVIFAVTARGEEEMPVQQGVGGTERSEEHTSELQSLMRISYAVFCLKKKRMQTQWPRQQ